MGERETMHGSICRGAHEEMVGELEVKEDGSGDGGGVRTKPAGWTRSGPMLAAESELESASK